MSSNNEWLSNLLNSFNECVFSDITNYEFLTRGYFRIKTIELNFWLIKSKIHPRYTHFHFMSFKQCLSIIQCLPINLNYSGQVQDFYLNLLLLVSNILNLAILAWLCFQIWYNINLVIPCGIIVSKSIWLTLENW